MAKRLARAASSIVGSRLGDEEVAAGQVHTLCSESASASIRVGIMAKSLSVSHKVLTTLEARLTVGLEEIRR